MTDDPPINLLKAHYDVVRLARVMRNVNLLNFAAALDAIERLLRAEIGDAAADANLACRKRPTVSRSSPRRPKPHQQRQPYGNRRLPAYRRKQ